MNKKIVYSLCSKGCDYYSVMARISVLSVRICSPKIDVNLLLDRQTFDAMKSAADPLLNEVDDVLICDVPDGSGAYRSRYLKTYARQIVTGAFLMLDCDLLVREDLSDLFSLDCDIAGAANHSRDNIEDQVGIDVFDMLTAMKWTIRSDIYINTGVLFFNDTVRSDVIGEKWHKYWLSSYGITGRHFDQPAFNAVICDEDLSLAKLSHRFNAQVKVKPEMANGAAVWHFYSSMGSDSTNVFDALVHSVLDGRTLRRAEVERMIRGKRIYIPGRRLIARIKRRLSRLRTFMSRSPSISC